MTFLLILAAVIFICGICIAACARDWYEARLAIKVMLLGLVIAFMVLLLSPASARDADGRYAQSPLKGWFDGLRSGKGPCCSDTDGSAISDADWETKDGHYRVRVDGEWWDVPDEAVITEPNKIGRTMVWPIRFWDNNKLTVSIRCFLPGAMI